MTKNTMVTLAAPKSRFTPVAHFGQAASSRKVPGGSKPLPFIMEATVLLGTFSDIFQILILLSISGVE